MSPLLLQLLRRLARVALIAALGLVVVPPVLRELEVIGPTFEEDAASTQRAVDAAQSYGAGDDLLPFVTAQRELARAQDLRARGERRAARRALKQAREQAIEAQRLALARRDDVHRQAKVIILEIEKRLEGLETTYAKVTSGLPKADTARLLSQMKDARRAGGLLYLAFEEGDFARVVRDWPATRTTLVSVSDALTAVKR